MGDRVPEVMTTEENLLKRGAMAKLESRQASCSRGSIAPGTLLPLGWTSEDRVKKRGAKGLLIIFRYLSVSL